MVMCQCQILIESYKLKKCSADAAYAFEKKIRRIRAKRCSGRGAFRLFSADKRKGRISFLLVSKTRLTNRFSRSNAEGNVVRTYEAAGSNSSLILVLLGPESRVPSRLECNRSSGSSSIGT